MIIYYLLESLQISRENDRTLSRVYNSRIRSRNLLKEIE